MIVLIGMILFLYLGKILIMDNEIFERNKKVYDFFLKNNVKVAFMGEKLRPIIVDISNLEVLNCLITDSNLLLFRISLEQKNKKFYIPIDKLSEDNNFDFNYWFKNSTKKKIYIFQNENQFFRRYNVKNDTYIPIFTEILDRSYFVFRLEKALLFTRKMYLKGINLKIIKQWENNHIKKIC